MRTYRSSPLDARQQPCDADGYQGDHNADHNGHLHARVEPQIVLEGSEPADDKPLHNVDRCEVLSAAGSALNSTWDISSIKWIMTIKNMASVFA